MRQHHFNLARRFLAHTVMLDHVRVSNLAPDVGLVSFNLRGWRPLEVARVLDETHHMKVGTGLLGAPNAHRYLGTWPEARSASVSDSNTGAEVDALAEAIGQRADMDVGSVGHCGRSV